MICFEREKERGKNTMLNRTTGKKEFLVLFLDIFMGFLTLLIRQMLINNLSR